MEKGKGRGRGKGKDPAEPTPKAGGSGEASAQRAEQSVRAFAARLGLVVKDAGILVRALTHASAKPAGESNNSKLGFLGDRLLNFLVCDYVARQFPALPAGALVDSTLLLCNNTNLFEVGKRLGISDALHYIPQPEDVEDRGYRHVVADAVEALVAAIYLDSGLVAARDFVARHIIPAEYNLDVIPFLRQKLPKKTLFDLLQRRGSGAPYYKILEEAGRFSHKSTFLVGVFSDGNLLAQGTGSAISLAEANAAQDAINAIWGKGAHQQLPAAEYSALE